MSLTPSSLPSLSPGDPAAGIEADPSQALQYFEQAAESGSAAAQTNLGLMYANGIGVEANNDTAVKHFEKAEAMGDGVSPLHCTAH